jgi:hypothetical protein
MIIVTQNAASSIALRNAIFRVIPRSLVDEIFVRVKQVAVGEGKQMVQKRAEIVDAFGRLGISVEQLLVKLECPEIGDITIEDIEVLIGYGTRIRDGESANDLFPKVGAPAPAKEGERTPLKKPESTKPTPVAKAVTPEQRNQDSEDQARVERGDSPKGEELPDWAKS